ncbi:MAG TPA: Smr/MutS family protein, partial [Alphaproteobacteria bacterium]|nr:Smr/MutS family protein [Alphaproteobacteria bacterium]
MAVRRPPADDAALFRAAMRDVKPLAHRRSASTMEAPAAPRQQPEAKRAASPRRDGSVAKPPPAPNPGIDRRTAERLRKGEIAIERRIDLHGMTQDDAHAALDRFVRQAWKDGKRMLLVITGKGSVAEGGGVLRRQVPRWLAVGEHAARLLRLEPAQPRHGGG